MVAKKSRPVKVSEEIKTWVVDRDLKQGDRLPNEAETEFGFRNRRLKQFDRNRLIHRWI